MSNGLTFNYVTLLSAYGRDDIMSWCESQSQVEYVLAYSSNQRLKTLTWGLEQRAKAAYEYQRQQLAQTLTPFLTPSDDLKADLDKYLD